MKAIKKKKILVDKETGENIVSPIDGERLQEFLGMHPSIIAIDVPDNNCFYCSHSENVTNKDSYCYHHSPQGTLWLKYGFKTYVQISEDRWNPDWLPLESQ